MSQQRTAASRMLRAQRARQMAGLPTAGFFGDILKGIGKVAAGFIPGGRTAVDVAERVFGGGRPDQKPGARADCPPGFRADPNTGLCEAEGVRAGIERLLPFGETGMLPGRNGFGEATVGAFGIPAIVPAQVSTAALRCPPGSVLGKDNLCYQPGSITKKFRKWPPGVRPKISAREWRTLSTANTVRSKAKEVAGAAGFTCRAKGSAPRKKKS